MHSKNTKNVARVSAMSLGLLALAGCGTTAPEVRVETSPVKETPPIKEETPEPVVETPVVTSSTSTVSVSTTVMVAPTPKPATPAHTYKDGTYSTVGTYKSPAGPEEIGVTVTLKNDIITDVTVVPKATAIKSKVMQADFIANYKTMVVGKNIAGLNLGKVSGSSLTPKGFNDAIDKIEAQAS